MALLSPDVRRRLVQNEQQQLQRLLASVYPTPPKLRLKPEVDGWIDVGGEVSTYVRGVKTTLVRNGRFVSKLEGAFYEQVVGALGSASGPLAAIHMAEGFASDAKTLLGGLRGIAAVAQVGAQVSSALAGFSSVAGMMGPYGAAAAAGVSLLVKFGGAFWGSRPDPPPLPSIDGINADEYTTTVKDYGRPGFSDLAPAANADRFGEIAGKAIAGSLNGKPTIRGKNDADVQTIMSVTAQLIKTRLTTIYTEHEGKVPADLATYRGLAICMANVPTSKIAEWLGGSDTDPRLIALVAALSAYGAPRAALREALGHLALLIQVEALEAGTWGQRDKQGTLQVTRLPRGNGRRCRVRIGTGDSGFLGAAKFRFTGRLTGYTGQAGQTSGQGELPYCHQGGALYQGALAYSLLPQVEGYQLVYPVPADVFLAEMAHYQTQRAELYLANIKGSPWEFCFPAGNESSCHGKRQYASLPSAPAAIKYAMKVADEFTVGTPGRRLVVSAAKQLKLAQRGLSPQTPAADRKAIQAHVRQQREQTRKLVKRAQARRSGAPVAGTGTKLAVGAAITYGLVRLLG